jgi:hypothetical protein
MNHKRHSTLKKKCDFADKSTQETSEWLAKWGPPIVDRINVAAPGANLVTSDLFHLFSLCSFDSVATMKPSSWCKLFTPEDFKGFEYYADLSKYYGTTGCVFSVSSTCHHELIESYLQTRQAFGSCTGSWIC